ncbi:MAG: IS982 family transposase [Acidobacteria bacterium]|nr:IS982 family transposase [Acidobacteriota bacterium]
MIDYTTELYCIVDDLLKAIGHLEDTRRTMSDSEVLTTALVAAQFFGSNLESARCFLQETGLMPRMLSRSRLCRRLHAVAALAHMLFHQLGAVLKEASVSTKYLLDSFPVPVCDNIRIARSRLARGERFRGRICSKRRYFYGVKVQVVTTEAGVPVEFAFLPGSASDTRGLDVLPLSLPTGSQLFMDSGYTDYGAEDAAQEVDGVEFAPSRKKNSKRGDDCWRSYYKQLMRKRIETVFSQITSLFPKHIHAVTLDGFLLKLSMFIIAFALHKAFI